MKPLHTSSQVTASDSRMVVRVMEISTPDGPVRRIVVEVNAEMDTTEARWLRDKLDLAITLAEGEDQSSTTVARGQAWLHCTGDPTRTLTVERVDKPLVAGVDNMTFVALRTVSGQPLRMLVSWLRAHYRPADLPVPAVSEDQPKPREETCGAGVEWSDGRRVCELDERHFGRHKNGNLLWWSDDRDQPASGDQLKPREWRKGDDEPPTDVTVLADQHGDLLTRRANGLWGWTRINGRKVNDMVPSPWADLAYWRDATAEEAERGPLSEVLADSEQVTR